ncbi:MAG: GH92 family glycosyl hydrolase [Bacteroidales bacterium]|nr:GH92 family glycosyl hydrolase [Bacteroidales bacterium]MCF8351831.1 GH92 family glycosyl hydrolase [Bacteroidales bacterium]MCF8376143.1 GH92 family glycosyl hydrolase [Bacteroidales bacterium]
MKRIWTVCLISVMTVLMFAGCTGKKSAYDHMDPFIGTDGHGHTFPGATMPFGMVQLSPDTRKDSWDGCSGYHYSDNTIMGFSHTHLSGTGVGDYGDIRIMPTVGELHLEPGTAEDPASGYRSSFSHDREKASPGYYAVTLDDYDIDVELTVTKRAGFHKYIFPETEQAHIIIDLFEGVTSDKVEFAQVDVMGNQVVAGVRKTDGWADNQRVYFYAVFSKPFKDFGILDDGKQLKTREKTYGENVKAWFDFDFEEGEEFYIRIGISPVSVEGAKLNLMHEIPGWDFKKTLKDARKSWEDQLAKIEVEGSDEQKTVFYTAMYHSFIAPNLFTDHDGNYRGHDGQTHQAKDFTAYTVFSLWDTFRATHPLFTIVERERSNDFVKTMLDIHDKGGLLPVWELAGNETDCMIGYHSVPVITDAWMKGIRDFDLRRAYDAMRRSAGQDEFGLKAYREYGYIPADKEGESVSKTLEYAYDDWCIARIAKVLERDNEYKRYIKRAQYYKNLFDDSSGFMRGKRNGMFVEPFNPAEVNFMLTEANTWQYTFFVPQDVSGLMELFGGEEPFTRKLDEMFSASADLSGRHQPDITGLIGQYAHGNEPSHHMAYLYNYAGKPWKSQEMVHRVLTSQYSDEPDGLCGNEDCGQMSSWYVLSAMGFYPVTPGDTIYAIGTPVMEKAVINLENSKHFEIKAEGVSEENFYIQSASLNGKPYNKSYITHGDIMRGGELVFSMGSEPNKKWGSGVGERPVSAITYHLIVPVPYFEAESHAFNDELSVEIKNIMENAEIYYTTDGSQPNRLAEKYTAPFRINKTITYHAKAFREGFEASEVAEATFNKIPAGRTVYLNSEYSSQYTAGGKIALIDGIRGGTNFRATGWQGYQGVDFDAVIDLGQTVIINRIAAGFLQDQRSWVFMPEKVKYYISTNGEDYRHVGTAENTVEPQIDEALKKDFELNGINQRARYVKVVAENIGKNPEWHRSPGGKSWLFVDEVMVE